MRKIKELHLINNLTVETVAIKNCFRDENNHLVLFLQRLKKKKLALRSVDLTAMLMEAIANNCL